jgi:hypothetical protein
MSAPLIERIVAAHKEVARSGSVEARSKLERLQAEYRSSGVMIERPGGTATLIEPGAISRTAAPPALEPRPATSPDVLDEVPALRTEMQSGFSVHLGNGALRGIMEELERSDFVLAGGSHETGGNLYGCLRAGVLELLDASGPGSDGNARRFESSVMVSLTEGFAIGEELSRQHQNALLVFCGGFHTHPIRDATPSPTDRSNALIGLAQLERKLGWRAPSRWLDVILTPDAVRGWDAPFATAWATRRLGEFGSVTERVQIEGS